MSDERLDRALQEWADERTWEPGDTDPFVEATWVRSARRRVVRQRVAAGSALAALLVLGIGLTLRPSPAPGPGSPSRTAEPPLAFSVLLNEGGSLADGTLAVEGDGRLVARLGSDIVAAGSRSRVVVEEARGSVTHLRLESGGVAAQVETRHGAGEFVIAAGPFVVRVVGTRFSVDRPEEGGIAVAVTEGTVHVRTGRSAWTVSAGEGLEVTASGEASQGVHSGARVVQLLSTAPGPAALEAELEVGPASDLGPAPTPAAARVPAPPTAGPAPVAGPTVQELRVRLLAGETAEVRAALEGRLAADPGDLDAWRLLATAARRGGDAEAALAAWTEVARRSDGADAAGARFEVAALLQRAGRTAEAAETFGALVNGGSLGALEPDARLRLAACLKLLGDDAGAEAELREIVRRFPGTSAADTAFMKLQDPSL